MTSQVKLSVYDILGREVAVLVDETKSPGKYEVAFSATAEASPAGVGPASRAACTSTASRRGSYVETRKMLLLK